MTIPVHQTPNRSLRASKSNLSYAVYQANSGLSISSIAKQYNSNARCILAQ